MRLHGATSQKAVIFKMNLNGELAVYIPKPNPIALHIILTSKPVNLIW
jgi:hypothetical protein